MQKVKNIKLAPSNKKSINKVENMRKLGGNYTKVNTQKILPTPHSKEDKMLPTTKANVQKLLPAINTSC